MGVLLGHWGRRWVVGCLRGAAAELEKTREHSAELPAKYNQATIVSITKINWPLLPKINVSVQIHTSIAPAH